MKMKEIILINKIKTILELPKEWKTIAMSRNLIFELHK